MFRTLSVFQCSRNFVSKRGFAVAFDTTATESLKKVGITNRYIHRNLNVSEYYELALNPQLEFTTDSRVEPTTIANNGAMVAFSGERTGRSPKDKRIVKDAETENKVWWGDVNIPFSKDSYLANRQRAIDWLNSRPRLYVVDGYGSWDQRYKNTVRVICSRPYHALFMRNMLIRPTPEEIERDFKTGNVDLTILNAGEFKADLKNPGVTNQTSVAINFTDKECTILGSLYAGEMKKGFFSVMQYLMPQRGVLTMHASANEGKKGDVTVLFGLSGTGKTTLSADPHRALIGDDEHCWTDHGVFNIEGGCYAKTINLSREKEPEIYDAIRFGSILENVDFKKNSKDIDYDSATLTENTRVCYPLEFIPGVKIPAIGGHPKNIIFLTCDASGVLPPVAKLTKEQTMYHFITGYTAKVAGTEMGVKEPQATFSACFGEAFLVLHPYQYAEMLAKKVETHGTKVWLINTGWTGGKYGTGKRMAIKSTRAIIDAIHDGTLEKTPTKNMPVFNLAIPESVPGVPKEVLVPRDTWPDKAAYDAEVKSLAKKFVENFKKYEDRCTKEVVNAGPQLS
jgi:phosphoenolpyruvate carboxykinase (ATP)